MATLETRLVKIEAKLTQSVHRWVRLVKKDRTVTDEECIRQHGYDPDDKNLNFIIREIVRPRAMAGKQHAEN